MPGFDRTGPQGMGPMTGGGRGLCNPRGGRLGGGRGIGYRGTSPGWPYVGRGRGGYARGAYPGFYGAPAYPYPDAGQQDIEDLKSQAQALQEQLARMEEQIKQMKSQS
ncbi:unnamed protein product [marine sediment metagenome]|uniref:DUF5320 domain-containing protein n=1 Tax=marine sediment metagenome TaxID=412755 RepID=X0WKH6_9ZZZZ